MVRLCRGAFTRCSIQVLDTHAKNNIERAWKEGYRTINGVSKPALSWEANKAQSMYLFKRKFKGEFSMAQVYPCQEGSSKAEIFHLTHESREDRVAENGR